MTANISPNDVQDTLKQCASFLTPSPQSRVLLKVVGNRLEAQNEGEWGATKHIGFFFNHSAYKLEKVAALLQRMENVQDLSKDTTDQLRQVIVKINEKIDKHNNKRTPGSSAYLFSSDIRKIIVKEPPAAKKPWVPARPPSTANRIEPGKSPGKPQEPLPTSKPKQPAETVQGTKPPEVQEPKPVEKVAWGETPPPPLSPIQERVLSIIECLLDAPEAATDGILGPQIEAALKEIDDIKSKSPDDEASFAAAESIFKGIKVNASEPAIAQEKKSSGVLISPDSYVMDERGVMKMIGDGNCLFRSFAGILKTIVSDEEVKDIAEKYQKDPQMARVPKPPEMNYVFLRALAAAYLNEHKDDDNLTTLIDVAIDEHNAAARATFNEEVATIQFKTSQASWPQQIVLKFDQFKKERELAGNLIKEGDRQGYIARSSQNRFWASTPQIVALSKIFNVNTQIWVSQAKEVLGNERTLPLKEIKLDAGRANHDDDDFFAAMAQLDSQYTPDALRSLVDAAFIPDGWARSDQHMRQLILDSIDDYNKVAKVKIERTPTSTDDELINAFLAGCSKADKWVFQPQLAVLAHLGAAKVALHTFKPLEGAGYRDDTFKETVNLEFENDNHYNAYFPPY